MFEGNGFLRMIEEIFAFLTFANIDIINDFNRVLGRTKITINLFE